MIIKIENVNGGWLIFDNVKDVLYQQYFTEKTEEDSSFVNEDNLVTKKIFGGNKKSYHKIYFSQDTRHFDFSTDRNVYLLNDDGKTIERLKN